MRNGNVVDRDGAGDQGRRPRPKSDIAHNLRCIKEAVWCFGDVLSTKHRLSALVPSADTAHLEHLKPGALSLSLERPSSLTSKAQVLETLDCADEVIELGKVVPFAHNCVSLDVAHLSHRLVEKERLDFGGKLGLFDVCTSDGQSYRGHVMALTLLGQLLCGKWLPPKALYTTAARQHRQSSDQSDVRERPRHEVHCYSWTHPLTCNQGVEP